MNDMKNNLNKNSKMLFMVLVIFFILAFFIDLLFFAKHRWEWGPFSTAFFLTMMFTITNAAGLILSIIIVAIGKIESVLYKKIIS